MNFYEQVKQDIIKTLRTNPTFKTLSFLDTTADLRPNVFNTAKPIGVVSVLSVTNVKPQSFCDDFLVEQMLTVEYHLKPDAYNSDWESRLNIIQAKIINTIETARKQGTLFRPSLDVELEFQKASVGQLKKQEIKEKIFSKATVVQYRITYDLGKVIEE